MKKKRLIIPTLALGILISAGALGMKNASAEGDYPLVIERLAERFGVDEPEVEAVFDSVRDEHHEQMQETIENKLNEAVQNGEITEEQKQVIATKHGEMHERRYELRDLSPEEREKSMFEHKEEMHTWAEENGIDIDSHFGLGEGKHMMMHHWEEK